MGLPKFKSYPSNRRARDSTPGQHVFLEGMRSSEFATVATIP
jgi:hypothetical protein